MHVTFKLRDIVEDWNVCSSTIHFIPIESLLGNS